MSVNIQTLAIILVIMHIISDIFMLWVLRRQYGLFKRPITERMGYTTKTVTQIKQIRVVLFALSLLIFAGNIIPIFIDGITILHDNPLHRPAHIPLVSLLYAFSTALVALISAYLIKTLYRIAAASDDPDELLERDIANREM